MNSQNYENYRKNPNPNSTVINIYNLAVSGKLSQNQLVISLTENLDILDDDVMKILTDFDNAFKIMKNQGIIKNYTCKITNRTAVFQFQ